ncbi:MAG: hypothetical protein QXY34_04090 [Candidatus Bathyarchaeia archaeon]
MGFSVTITSSIILIVMFALASTLLVTIFQGFREVSYAAGAHLRLERERSEVALQLSIDSANTTSCTLKVKNVGSKVIFLERQNGFSWNTIILSYSNGSKWLSYPIENYQVLEVRVSNKIAQKLYEKLGFKIVETIPGYYSDGEDAYYMVLSSNEQ